MLLFLLFDAKKSQSDIGVKFDAFSFFFCGKNRTILEKDLSENCLHKKIQVNFSKNVALVAISKWAIFVEFTEIFLAL